MENQYLDSGFLTTSYIDPDSYVAADTFTYSGHEDGYAANPLVSALENNDFVLLYQLIDPLDDASRFGRHYEVFLRLLEEEDSYLPPGAFFPLAEEQGLMPVLDRWVVAHVLQFAATAGSQHIMNKDSMFFVNLAGATIRDPEFPLYVQDALRESCMPGNCLCFEIAGSDIAHARADVARLAKALRELGCRIAISGFDRDEVTFKLISGLHIDFLKIDGSIIFNIHREAAELGKTAAIHKAARKLGIKTVAEFVESEEDISRLREIGIDFVQGFGVSRPGFFE